MQMELTVSCFSCGNFSQIPVVIAFHFKVEDLTFWITSFWNQIFVQKTLLTDAYRWCTIGWKEGELIRLECVCACVCGCDKNEIGSKFNYLPILHNKFL